MSGKASLEIATGDFGESGNPPRPNFSGLGQRVCTDGMSDWYVDIIKIPDGKNYTKDSEQKIGIRITTGGAYTLDIAYAAIVDTPEEAQALLREGETLVDCGSSWSGEIEAAKN